MILASDVIDRAKDLWRDSADNFSGYSLKWISDGIRELLRLRSDAGITEAGQLFKVTEITATTTEIDLDDSFLPCLVDYVLHRGYQENKSDDRAKAAFADFMRKAKGV